MLLVKAVDLEINRGEFVSLVGPSGSGKSTLLHIVGALDVPTAGHVSVNNIDLGSRSTRELTDLRLHNIGFVFQAYNLVPVLSAVENVEFILHLQGVAKQERRRRSLETLSSLGLDDVVDRRPSDMSGGHNNALPSRVQLCPIQSYCSRMSLVQI